MKSELHKLADEHVNVYEENERFVKLLERYYQGDKSVYNDLWLIAYRASCNILKKRVGKIYKYEDIENMALDMLTMLFNRINNKDRWPCNYSIKNLPTVLEYIYLTIFCSKKKVEEDKINKISLDQLKEMYNYEVEEDKYGISKEDF